MLQMEPKDKGKRKVIQPLQFKKNSSSMSISSDEENKSTGNKLMQSAINAQNIQTAKIHSAPQMNQIMDPQFLKKFNPSKVKQWDTSSSTQTTKDTVVTFGNYSLPKCYDVNKKFRPMIGMELTEEQQCLLDNLWHIQTVPQASTFKVQVLNALSVYFSEQKRIVPQKQSQRFSHYVIYRGTKLGIFNKWDTMRKYIQCSNPIFKGYHSFAEAMKFAREEFGLQSFYIEPEEVKTFSEIAKTNPEQMIKAQEEVIAKLQQQLIQSGKNQHDTQIQIENSFLKQQKSILEEKLLKLQTKLENKDSETHTAIHRDFNSFKARIIDIPWRHTMQPILDRIPELESVISQKICTEFPLILYELQQQIIDIAFNEDDYTGVTVVQRLYNNQPVYNRLLLQIDLRKINLTSEQILKFYHNGMIDYIEYTLNPKTESLLDKFGEKFILTAGNIASYSDASTIGCKIFASFPEADSHTYRPSRKRIFISHRDGDKAYLKKLACTPNLHFDHMKELNAGNAITEPWVMQGQETPKLPASFVWNSYKLLAEGHYIQIWSHYNWDMYLPFIGESDVCPIEISNREQDIEVPLPSSPVSVDSTHRDF